MDIQNGDKCCHCILLYFGMHFLSGLYLLIAFTSIVLWIYSLFVSNILISIMFIIISIPRIICALHFLNFIRNDCEESRDKLPHAIALQIIQVIVTGILEVYSSQFGLLSSLQFIVEGKRTNSTTVGTILFSTGFLCMINFYFFRVAERFTH